MNLDIPVYTNHRVITAINTICSTDKTQNESIQLAIGRTCRNVAAMNRLRATTTISIENIARYNNMPKQQSRYNAEEPLKYKQ